MFERIRLLLAYHKFRKLLYTPHKTKNYQNINIDIDAMIEDVKTNHADEWKQIEEENCERLGHPVLPGQSKCFCGLVTNNIDKGDLI